MSHVANPQISWSALPDDIKEKIRLFRKQEKLKSHLAAQLEEAQRAHAQLERELAPYSDYLMLEEQKITRNVDRIVHSTQGGPIFHCPEEVLLEIFQYYLIDYHPNIRILLRVCKDWNRIVMHRPTLWIRIQTPDKLEHGQDFDDLVTPYVRACLKRSQNLPLDIELNLERLPSFAKYAISYLYESLADIVDKKDHDLMQHDLSRALRKMEWPSVSWTFNYHFLNLLNRNVGR
jgi:hypothetical protein